MALRIKGKGSVFQDVPVTGALSAALLEWKDIQEGFKAPPDSMAPGGIAFAGSQFVFAGYSGAPFSNRAFNLRLRAACRALGVGEITAHGLRHSAATILLNHVGKDLAGNPGAPPPQEYPHHRALHPRRLRTDAADRGGAQPGFGVKATGVAISSRAGASTKTGRRPRRCRLLCQS